MSDFQKNFNGKNYFIMNDSYSKKMLKIIAICAVFVTLTWGTMFSIVSFQIIKSWLWGEKEGEDIRKIHLKQHEDEQVQYRRIIELMEEMIEIFKKQVPK